MNRKVLIAAAAIVIVGLVLYAWLKPVARVASVTSGIAVKAVAGNVTVEAEFAMELKSEIAGRIVKSDLEIGGKVPAGTILAQVDPGDLQLTMEQTQNDYEAAKQRIAVGSAIKLDLDTARESLAEFERLTKTGQYPQAELDKQRRIVKQIEQRLALEDVANKALIESYENTIKVQHRQLEKMTVTAPFDGIVSAVLARPGDLIGANAPIATLISTSRTVEAKISQEDFTDIKLGQKATVRFLGRENDIYPATVEQILPTADSDTQRYTVYLKVACPLDVLVPGLTGEANIVVGERAAKALIPRRALFGNHVYAVEGGRVQLRKVEVGFVDFNIAEITSGLATGDQVIVDGLDKFRDGDRVSTELVK
ncbi:MAG: efflux RND transporter periplasmic adaptor subunit [Opitutaceae bacterium]